MINALHVGRPHEMVGIKGSGDTESPIPPIQCGLQHETSRAG